MFDHTIYDTKKRHTYLLDIFNVSIDVGVSSVLGPQMHQRWPNRWGGGFDFHVFDDRLTQLDLRHLKFPMDNWT